MVNLLSSTKDDDEACEMRRSFSTLVAIFFAYHEAYEVVRYIDDAGSHVGVKERCKTLSNGRAKAVFSTELSHGKFLHESNGKAMTVR